MEPLICLPDKRTKLIFFDGNVLLSTKLDLFINVIKRFSRMLKLKYLGSCEWTCFDGQISIIIIRSSSYKIKKKNFE